MNRSLSTALAPAVTLAAALLGSVPAWADGDHRRDRREAAGWSDPWHRDSHAGPRDWHTHPARRDLRPQDGRADHRGWNDSGQRVHPGRDDDRGYRGPLGYHGHPAYRARPGHGHHPVYGGYHGHHPVAHWRRGDVLPRHMIHERHVIVDHRRHAQLMAPPRGHRWVEVDGGDLLLVAVATGVIASVILNR